MKPIGAQLDLDTDNQETEILRITLVYVIENTRAQSEACDKRHFAAGTDHCRLGQKTP